MGTQSRVRSESLRSCHCPNGRLMGVGDRKISLYVSPFLAIISYSLSIVHASATWYRSELWMFEDIVKTLNLVSRVSELAANEYVLKCWSADDGNTSVYWESFKKKKSILLGCVPALLFFPSLLSFLFFCMDLFLGANWSTIKKGLFLWQIQTACLTAHGVETEFVSFYLHQSRQPI